MAALLDLSLLRSRPFLTFASAVTLVNTGYFVPYVHLVAQSLEAGYSDYQAASLISLASLADLVSRPLSGWFSDLRRVRLVHSLAFWTFLTGLTLALMPLASPSLPALGPGLSLAYGFCSGALTPVVFSLLPEIVGVGRIYGALGLLQLVESVGGLLGAPLSGWLRDLTGSYTASFLMAGGFLALASLVMLALPNALPCCLPSPLTPGGPGEKPGGDRTGGETTGGESEGEPGERTPMVTSTGSEMV